ncbi:Chemotaxis regulator - transmits chemoreceptor signals to flagellar motor components CheY [hydrothermal vent metagenome]|uniref:Chemotaxis regulator - transmits chemoreceptor signals to flagellar motor components CheY n=1 Tax=hydrothermal vent metagenome TaxID=652676 RepID=A0A3B0QSJ2_9ZZZZ
MDKTILIVDDAPTIRQMVGFALKGNGNFNVVEAGDGKEALEKLKGGLKPNLVITDLNMPNMDGITMIKNIRQMAAHKFTPILMLTTESLGSKKQEGQAAGATGWIVKPFKPEELVQVVGKVIK